MTMTRGLPVFAAAAVALSLAANVACTSRSVAGSSLPSRSVTVAQSGEADVVGADSAALQKAADMLRAGDTLVIGPGTYQMDCEPADSVQCHGARHSGQDDPAQEPRRGKPAH